MMLYGFGFASSLPSMLYFFSLIPRDVQYPLTETVNLVEDLALEYIQEMVVTL
jgi:hypothetical protein